MNRLKNLILAAAAGGLMVLGATTGAHAVPVIYAATGGSSAGSLYTLDPTTGAATLVGALVDSAGAAYALTALDYDPISNTLYGGTSNTSPTARSNLVTVNPLTGLVTVIGAYGIPSTMADFDFSAGGILYGWESAGSHQLFTINAVTGAATLVPGSPAFGGFGGGGLAFDSSGTLYATPDGNTNPPGTLRTVDPLNGSFLTTVVLSGSPINGSNAINGLDGSLAGLLYGINDDFGGAQLAHLVTIDKVTGAITSIGSTGINGLDAIALIEIEIPEPATLAFLSSGLAGIIVLRRRRRKARG